VTEITIVHLYPRELGINGDVGNVTALRRRAEWRGMPVRVVDVGPGDQLPDSAHLVHVGSGPASSRAPLHDDVARLAPTLQKWAADGVPFLAIAAGWQLLGREVIELDRTVRAGAKVFPSAVVVSADRIVGEVAGESELGEVAGFVNYGATTILDRDVASLARLRDTEDGLVAGNLVATNLHGPFLPMNPAWADRLLSAAAQLAGLTPGPDDPRIAVLDDRARRSRDAIRARL
jgi:CobQ-like glutamine amidotransferase family enzyme